MRTLILGSQSPRRKEILNFFNVPFVQISPHFDEEAAEVLDDPVAYAISLARGKALSLCQAYPEAWILGADTVVFKEGRYFSKPRDREEARAFLKDFSGKWQVVVTGLALAYKGQVWTDHGQTRVLFNALSESSLETYLNKNIWQDKAGGYTILGSASLLVEKIEGCFYNVMGLPVNALKRILTHAGIELA